MAKEHGTAKLLLKIHLEEMHVGKVVQEFPFAKGRRFRADLAIPEHGLLFECDGHFQGKHGVGYGEGHEKINLAQALGFRCFQFSNRDVLSGKAKAWLAEYLFSEKSAVRGSQAQQRGI